MFHVVLHQPVIPQNTGSIARLCACTGAALHLIHPLGFRVDEASVKRAGLDYWPHVDVREHASWEAFVEKERPEAFFLFTKHATRPFYSCKIPDGSYFVLGAETTGLPAALRERHADRCVRIPMRTHLVRSLNLAQAAAIVLYEGLRQNGMAELP